MRRSSHWGTGQPVVFSHGWAPLERFDEIRAALRADRAQFWKDLSLPFYGYNRPARRSQREFAKGFGCRG